MYSRGNNAYGQQSYSGQSGYGQKLAASYSASSVGGPDGGSQLSKASQHSSILGSSQEAEVGTYRTHPSAATHYGGQYSSIYSSITLTSTQQVPSINAKGSVPSALEGHAVYASAMTNSPKFTSSDYVSSSSHGYSHQGDYAEKIPDYPTVERRQYGERQSGYMGRDLASEPAGRYTDSIGFGHPHQSDIYDCVEQAVLLRQEQLLKAQSAALDGGSRQADFLAARASAGRHTTQDLMPYGGRMDADLHNVSTLSSSSYNGQHAPSILGAAPRRNVDDLMYPPSSANPRYGVSLPPGRDYGSKGLHASLESDYLGGALSRGGHPRIDEHKDDRAGYLREFELREQERRREHLREREREREREKEREREWLRERERLRILERREKVREWEREREHKRALEIKRERTPPRSSRDHRGSSLTKDVRPLRRDSPRREALHRRHSPVKEKRREYVCKVYSSNLVEVERDYLSIDKRYPRLYVPPHFSKAVVNWPKENLKLSFHTPVSFEHDLTEEDCVPEVKELCSKLWPKEPAKSEQSSTVWNAKIILISGLSKSSLEDLSSEKFYDDRIPHICNILRFAVLKRDHSFMAIGGQWNAVDGGNPSDDDSSLIQTALRYAKDVTNLDLQNCQNWNRFLEIHYDRVGKDGLFSHKEVTVLFVPDLSESLPSLDMWRRQWLAHKKAVTEREHQLSLKRERSREKKEGSKDMGTDSANDPERGKPEKNEYASCGQGTAVDKEEKGGNRVEVDAIEGKGGGSNNKVEIKDGNKNGGQYYEKMEQAESSITQASASSKKRPVKKIIKRIVKQKVVNKAVGAVNAASKQNDKMDEDVSDQNAKSEISGHQEEPSADPAGDIMKSVVAKEAISENFQSEDNSILLEVKAEMDGSDDKSKDNSDPSIAVAVKKVSGKTTIKKKIIKRVPKRKVCATQASDGVVDTKKDGHGDEKKVAQTDNETKNKGNQTILEKEGSAANSSKLENKADKKDVKGVRSSLVADKQSSKSKDSSKTKDEKVKVRDSKDESKSNSNKELKEKKKSEEPPRNPGLILQTKGSKESKLQSLSLSLESLLDYTDKDVEESTFELSLFAETLYEMLQYQMGCRLLTFLQKLRIRFVTKRNQQKRQWEESEKENEKKSPAKHLKTSEIAVKNDTAKSETPAVAQQNDEQSRAKEETTIDHDDEAETKDEAEDEEPEEDPEEYEELDDESPLENSCIENKEEKTDVDPEPERQNENEMDEESMKDKITEKVAEKQPQPDGDLPKINTWKKEESVDKKLLQAFRFFDRNQVGYIRVEDLRLIIHSMGEFLSHRDVKELVQSALLESNSGRDDRILYNKLMRMSRIGD